MDNIVCKTMDFNVNYQLDTCAQHQIQSTYKMRQVVTQSINNLVIKTKVPYVISRGLIVRYGAILTIQNHKSAQHWMDKTAISMHQVGT